MKNIKNRKTLLIFLFLLLLFLPSCYRYRYQYRLIKIDDINIPWNTIEADGVELITYFPEKYYLVLGVIDKSDKIILFNKRLNVIIKQDQKIYATSLDGEALEIPLENVKFYYVKRVMPSTEEENKDP
ncbi:MAG: hypothetical protein JW737_06410 [Acidobacteria bacterium]|nr:hypothetical protein [Acidobacteriota bacterium]